jgi:hypothetical protein
MFRLIRSARNEIRSQPPSLQPNPRVARLAKLQASNLRSSGARLSRRYPRLFDPEACIKYRHGGNVFATLVTLPDIRIFAHCGSVLKV